MKKQWIAAAVIAACVASPAFARVNVGIGLDVPVVAPAPVVYAPAPAAYAPPPVPYYAAPYYYNPYGYYYRHPYHYYRGYYAPRPYWR